MRSRLIPTHTSAELSFSLSLADWAPLFPVSQAPTCTRPLPPAPSPSLGYSPLFFLVLIDPIGFQRHLLFHCSSQDTDVLIHTNAYACSGCWTSSWQVILDRHVTRNLLQQCWKIKMWSYGVRWELATEEWTEVRLELRKFTCQTQKKELNSPIPTLPIFIEVTSLLDKLANSNTTNQPG